MCTLISNVVGIPDSSTWNKKKKSQSANFYEKKHIKNKIYMDFFIYTSYTKRMYLARYTHILYEEIFSLRQLIQWLFHINKQFNTRLAMEWYFGGPLNVSVIDITFALHYISFSSFFFFISVSSSSFQLKWCRYSTNEKKSALYIGK